MLRSNKGAQRLFGTFLDATALSVGVATNLMRATLHPAGLRPYIVNFAEVAAVAIDRIERAALASRFHPKDDARRALLEEVRAYPGIAVLPRAAPSAAPMAVLHLRRGADELRLFALLTTIGTPLDITAEHLTLESFFPADEPTERWFRT